MTFYTYGHYTESGRLFYIGKGKGTRAFNKSGRSDHWKNIVNKHGLKVEVFAQWSSEDEAFEHERFLISCFRKDLGFDLCNKTDGGEGRSGWVPDEAFRAMVSRVHTGRVNSDETRAKMSESALRANQDPDLRARKRASWTPERRAANGVHGRAVMMDPERNANIRNANPSRMRGKTHSEETKAKMSVAASGENNPMYGKHFHHTEEAKAKISVASKNRIITPEARANISASAKAAWARRKSNLENNRA